MNVLLRTRRVLMLMLVVLVGLLGLVGESMEVAHAAMTIPVTICDDTHLRSAINQANIDNDGDTITFTCSGDISLTGGTLNITGSMTLDGSGQSVTLDGHNGVQVLHVHTGITFTLNALTVANGLIVGSFPVSGGRP